MKIELGLCERLKITLPNRGTVGVYTDAYGECLRIVIDHNGKKQHIDLPDGDRDAR